MNLQDTGFDISWGIVGFVLYGIALLWAIKKAPWYKIKDKASQHVFFATTVVVFFFWYFSASIGEGLTFHFLMSAVITLMFGAHFAIILISLTLIGVTIMGEAGWLMFGMNAFLMGVLPIMIVWWMALWAYRYLDRNFFVFVLLNGFLAAGLSSIITLSLAGGVMYLSGAQHLEKLQQSFFPYIPLMAFPEAFINGMLILTLILMKPQWVSCFTDEQYLKGK